MRTPIFWAEGHPGPLDAQRWTVDVDGLVERPATFTWEQILALPKSVADARLTSVSGFTVGGQWGGVKLSDLMTLVKAKPEASHLCFTSYRRIYTTCIPMDVALRERTLMAYEFDGEPLEEDYGGPVRIFCPYLWGYKSAKSLIAITAQDHSTPGYWEKLGYPDSAQIKKRWILDVNSGRQRRISGGEVTGFVD
jgi:DMSO/TMAO reductase YedYZ molybdopterin-dependent catalytic subunit